jgi:hypothetical protein
MGRQLITMGVGMGIMPWSERRFHLLVVGRVRMQVIHRVVSGIFLIAFPVLSGT